MKFFIHKIISGKTDEVAHLQFEKFSKGIFKDRAIVQCKKSSGKYSLVTTSEYANEFVRVLAEKLGNKSTKVTGVIVSTKDLSKELKYKDKSQFMGIKKYSIEQEMSGDELLKICALVPRAFIGLSFSFGENELKIKPKAPKSAKPSSSEDGPKVDFCKLKTSDESVVKDLLFDIGDFRQAEAKHDFIIDQITAPKDEPDPVKMREKAIRGGKIIRHITVDGSSHTKEYPFSA